MIVANVLDPILAPTVARQMVGTLGHQLLDAAFFGSQGGSAATGGSSRGVIASAAIVEILLARIAIGSTVVTVASSRIPFLLAAGDASSAVPFCLASRTRAAFSGGTGGTTVSFGFGSSLLGFCLALCIGIGATLSSWRHLALIG